MWGGTTQRERAILRRKGSTLARKLLSKNSEDYLIRQAG